MYFGSQTRESVNLNFVDFTWGVSESSAARPVVVVLAMIVVLFPALDTLSVFPLIANTLGNNLNAAFPSMRKCIASLRCFSGSDKESIKKTTIVFWRLVASLPPVLFSRIFTDLSLTFQLAGMCGIIVALITPALLQRYSYIRVASTKLTLELNPYTSYFSAKIYTEAVLLIAGVALIICVAQILNVEMY
jgi:hypothetical protein